MFSKFERLVAFRYLRSRRKDGFISVTALFSFLGIALGVATLIIVMAVMNGFRKELFDRVLGINSHVSVYLAHDVISDYEGIERKLRGINGVDGANAVIKGEVLATANDRHNGSFVRGLTLRDLKTKKLVMDNIVAGNIEDFREENSVVIGKAMSENLRLLPGDTIRLISPKTTETFLGAMPRIKDYTVAAIFDIGMIEYDSSAIFMPIKAAQLYFKTGDAAHEIEVYSKPEMMMNLEQLKEEISLALGPEYEIIDWQEANSSFVNALKVERNVMFLILTLIILVASLNIISGMVMLVKNKGKEIAILRTMGATRGAIMRIFFICGSSIGVFGTLLGFLLGLGFSLNIENIRRWLESAFNTELFSAEIYYLTKLPADVQADDVLLVVIMSLTLSFLATLYPAWKAAKTDPVEGLRYE